MIAREWKATCPLKFQDAFKNYLFKNFIKESSKKSGFIRAQILTRDLGKEVEITLITYWSSIESIAQCEGQGDDIAKLCLQSDQFQLKFNRFIHQYRVKEPELSEA
ncbi:hypothetical protein [Vibrio sonorensis]|uniref:hypothetical protein n=1 Tax=Vibrio sonorensis TaxID=1004316 RepID=UPI0008DABEBF|nr:hypothetical protein [Vibrio sonorensis]